MGNIKKLDYDINPITIQDGRGAIFTYFPVRDNIVEWSLVYTNKNSIRGQHRHPEFDEYIFFIDGFGVYEEKLDSGEVEIIKVATGDCIYIPVNTYHTFIPLTDDCKAVALITKKWDDCSTPIIKK